MDGRGGLALWGHTAIAYGGGGTHGGGGACMRVYGVSSILQKSKTGTLVDRLSNLPGEAKENPLDAVYDAKLHDLSQVGEVSKVMDENSEPLADRSADVGWQMVSRSSIGRAQQKFSPSPDNQSAAMVAVKKLKERINEDRSADKGETALGNQKDVSGARGGNREEAAGDESVPGRGKRPVSTKRNASAQPVSG